MWHPKGSEWVSLDQDVSPSRLEINLQRAAVESPAPDSRHDEAWQGQVSSTMRSKAGILARVVLAHNYTGP